MNAAVAHSGPDRKAHRLRQLRQQQEARVRFWRLFVVVTFFVIALSGNLFIGAMVFHRAFGNPFTWGQTPEPTPTAQIRRPLLDGTFCRNITFDNNTAHAITDRVERCDAAAAKQKVRTRTQFSWGGR